MTRAPDVAVWAIPRGHLWALIVGIHENSAYTETIITGPVTADAALHRLTELRKARRG